MYMLDRTGILRGLPFPITPGSDYSVFWVWTVALAFSQALLNRTLSLRWRLALAGLAVTTLYAGLSLRSWNSGWVPPLVAVYVIACLGIPRLAIPLSLVGLAVALPHLQEIMSLWSDPKNQYDLLSRTAAWRILWEIIQIDPILGIGFANYYWYTPLYPLFGWAARFNSHNNYVDVVAQTGFVGLACLAWFTFQITRLAWRLRTLAPPGFARAYAYGALGGLAGMLVSAGLGDWILPFAYNIGLVGVRSSLHGWFFLGGLVAVEQIALKSSQRKDEFDQVRSA
jgi:O-antigen ligase